MYGGDRDAGADGGGGDDGGDYVVEVVRIRAQQGLSWGY